MPTNYPGASREVLEQHWAVHQRGCPGDDLINMECPCGSTVVQLCVFCWELLFVHVEDAPCRHVGHIFDPILAAGWGMPW
jgi:hypothetical protein